MKAHCQIFGKENGNFRVSQVSREVLLGNLDRIRSRFGLHAIFSPQCDFTTRIESFDPKSPPEKDWFTRSAEKADGGVVHQPGVAVALFNADCPVISIFERPKHRLTLLHAGFRCVIREKKGETNIIRAAFDLFKFSPHNVRVFVGYGIGPCCFGARYPEIANSSLNLPVAVTSRGPRAGETSVNLYEVIRREIRSLGVPETSIKIDSTCTACAGGYHSNTYDGSLAGRNAVLAWFS